MYPGLKIMLKLLIWAQLSIDPMELRRMGPLQEAHFAESIRNADIWTVQSLLQYGYVLQVKILSRILGHLGLILEQFSHGKFKCDFHIQKVILQPLIPELRPNDLNARGMVWTVHDRGFFCGGLL